MNSLRSRLLGVLLACCAIATPAGMARRQNAPASKQAELPPDVARLREWVRAVQAYHDGSVEALQPVAVWSAADLKATVLALRDLRQVLARAYASHGRISADDRVKSRNGGPSFPADELQRLLGLTDDEARKGDVNRLLRRGVLMHSDIGVLVSIGKLSAGPSPAGLPRAVRVLDGARQGPDDSIRHWQMGIALFDSVTPEPARDETVHLWYLATAAYMRRHYLLVQALDVLNRARELFPDDADFQFYSGCLDESQAAPRIQAAVASAMSAVVVRGSAAPITGRTVSASPALWERAATYFRAALKLRPEWPEARMRLGHVYGLLGRHREAATELRAALDATKDPTIIYCASLFLGAEEQALGDRVAARGFYEQALKYRQRAQSPHLALSLLARATGDRGRALDEVRAVFGLPPDEAMRYDPLWDYYGPPSTKADTLFAQLRALIQEEARQ